MLKDVKSIKSVPTSLRRHALRQIAKRRLPYTVTLTDFDKVGVRFELSNIVEYFRVVEHGEESQYLAAMLAHLRPDDVLFDVGANVGLVALHASKICRTVAFEPDPSFKKRLEINSGLNADRSFDIEPIAISDADGNVDLFTDGADGNSPSLVHQRGESGSVSVSARSLDSIMAEGRLPRPTVVKMDIEGAEILALRGGRNLLSGPERPRSLFIEVHNGFLPGFGSSATEVFSLLAEYGYDTEIYRAERGGQTHLILGAS
jgi:FkbM family methyltransferase